MAGVASEFGRAMFLGDVEPEVVRGLLARTLPGGAGSGLLLGHGDVEAGAVDGKVLGAKGILCELVGNAVGGVELESDVARQRVASLHVRRGLLKEPEPLGARVGDGRKGDVEG